MNIIRYKINCLELYEKQGGRCMCCGKYLKLSYNIFAHIFSKNKMTAAEKLTHFIMICPELHEYQHRLSNNLKSHPCVKLFLENYYTGQKNFYKKFIEVKGIEFK